MRRDQSSQCALLDSAVPPHPLCFRGHHAWQGAGTSGAPPLPSCPCFSVSPELSPRRGLHSFGWRQAPGASLISAPPTSPPPASVFSSSGRNGPTFPPAVSWERRRQLQIKWRRINKPIPLPVGWSAVAEDVIALCAHAGERSRSRALLVGLPGLSLRGEAIEGSGQWSGSIFQPLEVVMDVHPECLLHPTRPQRRRGCKARGKTKTYGKILTSYLDSFMHHEPLQTCLS